MRSPALALAENLIWTRHGTCWALWQIEPLPYGMRPTKDKQLARQLHQALIRALPGESLWLSVCAGLDPVSVVQRMLEGTDSEEAPDWRDECEATLGVLDQLEPGQRVNWIALPLPSLGGRDRLGSAFRAAEVNIHDRLGIPRWKPSPAEVARRREQAYKRSKLIPRPFKPRAAVPSQFIWLASHAQNRGLFMDDLPETPAERQVVDDQLRVNASVRGGGIMPDPVLDEGGRSDLEGERWGPRKASERRFLKVMDSADPATLPASYQVMSVLADLPENGMEFPGCELLGRIDEFGDQVDWAMRLTQKSSNEVLKANRKALRDLNEQFDQRDSEVTLGGEVGMLRRAADDLTEYAAILEKDRLEVECQPTIIFTTSGPTAEAAQDRANELHSVFADVGYRLQIPLGEQENLWWASYIGTPSTRIITDYAGVCPSISLASMVPYASTELGDNSGSLLAVNISTGRAGVVLHSIASASRFKNVSGSIAIAGDLGAGKSLLLKKLAGDVVAQNGQVIALDRTEVGEWAFWARSMTNATVVNIAEPEISLDPIRIYGGTKGARVAQSFLTRLLGVSARTEMGTLLSRVLRPDFLEHHQLTGLGDLRHFLENPGRNHDLRGVEQLAAKITMMAELDLGKVIFDNSLPALDPTVPATVIRTHALQLPSDHEVENRHLFDEMPIDKIFGRALYGLCVGLARLICFADISRLAMFMADEAHHITRMAEGREGCTEFVRDGRKHNAAIALGSHDPMGDFGDETLRGLIPTRIQMRQRDRTLAQRGLKWLDLDPDDEDLIAQLTSDTSPPGPHGPVEEHRRGEAFMRDMDGNIGRIKVLAPASEARNKAARTSTEELEELMIAGGDTKKHL